MKVKSFSVLMVAAVAFLITGFSVSPLQASQYLGEITWNYSGTGGGGAITVKAGLSKVGGSYYELQGQAATPNGTIIFSGGGALVGDTLMLSAASTMVETNNNGVYHDATVLKISVDQSYNGTMWMVTNWYNPAFNPPFGQSYDTGTLTKISGPSNPVAVPLLPLLLN